MYLNSLTGHKTKRVSSVLTTPLLGDVKQPNFRDRRAGGEGRTTQNLSKIQKHLTYLCQNYHQIQQSNNRELRQFLCKFHKSKAIANRYYFMKRHIKKHQHIRGKPAKFC